MKPDLIKYVSIDKLVRYEKWDGSDCPEYVLQRMGSVGFTVSKIDVDVIHPSFRVVRRIYEFYERYAAEETGHIVWKYRERA